MCRTAARNGVPAWMAARSCCRTSAGSCACALALPRALSASACACRHLGHLQPLFHGACVPWPNVALTRARVARSGASGGSPLPSPCLMHRTGRRSARFRYAWLGLTCQTPARWIQLLVVAYFVCLCHVRRPALPIGVRVSMSISVTISRVPLGASGKARYSLTLRREIVLSSGWSGSSATQMALWSPCRQPSGYGVA
jgi:hypothetical protein